MDGFKENYDEYSERHDREVAQAEHLAVLVIDDLRDIKGLPDDAVVCRTLERGTRLLFSQAWDVVYLDHDLGYGRDGNSKVTIRPLVTELERRAHDGGRHPVGKFIVVTDNPAGAAWMHQALSPRYTTEREHVACTINWDGVREQHKEWVEDGEYLKDA